MSWHLPKAHALCDLSVGFPLPVTLSPLSCHYSAPGGLLRPCPARGHNAGHMPTHYTYTEAARILGVSRRTPQDWATIS